MAVISTNSVLNKRCLACLLPFSTSQEAADKQAPCNKVENARTPINVVENYMA